MPGYQSRMIAHAAQKRMTERPTPTQADFDAKPFILTYHYGDTGVSREIHVLALDEGHAQRLGELRNARQLIDMTHLKLASVNILHWSADVLARVLEHEDADEWYDRQQEWKRRKGVA